MVKSLVERGSVPNQQGPDCYTISCDVTHAACGHPLSEGPVFSVVLGCDDYKSEFRKTTIQHSIHTTNFALVWSHPIHQTLLLSPPLEYTSHSFSSLSVHCSPGHHHLLSGPLSGAGDLPGVFRHPLWGCTFGPVWQPPPSLQRSPPKHKRVSPHLQPRGRSGLL